MQGLVNALQDSHADGRSEQQYIHSPLISPRLNIQTLHEVPETIPDYNKNKVGVDITDRWPRG